MRSLILYIFVAVTVCCLTMLSSCRQSIDGRLIHAEEIMEEHPDSALQILTEMDSPASEYDRHLHTILLAHARYKNFLDFGNDSTLRTAAEYFIEKDEARQAAKAFFLLGIHQMESDRLGESVLSLTRGLDIARSKECPMEEGQCARGLFFLYGKILDSSAQLKYANQAYEAFEKGGYKDWMAWSRLDIAAALNNNGQYEKAILEAEKIIKDPIGSQDTTLMADTYSLISTSNSALGNHSETIKNFVHALQLSPSSITDDNRMNLYTAVANIDNNLVTRDLQDLINNEITDSSLISFQSLALKGDYALAYKNLENYRLRQDSVLACVLHNNVAESLSQYMSFKNDLADAKMRIERLTWILIGLTIIIAGGIFINIQRNRLRKNEENCKRIADNLNCVRQDLALQIQRNMTMKESMSKVIVEKYKEVNEMCESYYECGNLENHQKGTFAKAKEIVGQFRETKFLNEIRECIDLHSDNLYSSFEEDFPGLKTDGKRLFLYLVLGFSIRSISAILELEPDSVYNRKSRLKARIKASSSTRKEEYLKVF